MSKRYSVLTISANDSAGMAGMSMDIRSQSSMGVHSLSVISANTAQNNSSVLSINPVAESTFKDQLLAISQMPYSAIKIGLLGSEFQCHHLAQFIGERSVPMVLDPVLGSTSGSKLSSSALTESIKKNLFPITELLTPNISEAELLTTQVIKNHDDVIAAADSLLALGVNAVLIKGGHFESTNSHYVEDYFTDGKRSFWLTSPKVDAINSRGTGCALSSSIAASLALGYSLYDSVVIGKMSISQALRQGYCLENEKKTISLNGPVSIKHFPDQQIDLPYLSRKPWREEQPFLPCNHPQLGLYPVIDEARWIEKLAPSGISTVQLRNKSLSGKALDEEIFLAVSLAKKHNIRLFINDYWQLAIKHGAYGVHLGQEDLDGADVSKINQAGLRLGISTHCHYEVARAHAFQPSYIACGPVFHTTTKDMPWVPHGLLGLRYWRETLTYPLVAIGGINQERFNNVAKTGVDSVAMITAITQAKDPTKVAFDFKQRFDQLAITNNAGCTSNE